MTVILVSGANQGLGYELVRALGKYSKEYTLLLGARNHERGVEAVSKLASEGIKTELIDLDITKDESIDAAFETVKAKYGVLDVLVNNAGVVSPYSEEFSRAEFARVLDTNVVSVGLVTQKFVSLLIKSDKPRVVNISSSLGSNAKSVANAFDNILPFLMPYNSSKAALNLITNNFRNYWEKLGYKIKLTLICPGYCSTNMTGHAGVKTAEEGAKAAFLAITTDNFDIPFATNLKGDDLVAVDW